MNNWPRMHLYPLRLTGLPVICSLRTPSTRQCILRGLRKDFAKVSREILASRGGLALQVVSGGVAWLVDRQLRAARQLHRGKQPPALVAGWMGDGDAPGGQVRQRLLDIVTHQVELVLARPVCGMHGDLGGRQLEDQPATAGVDSCKSEHVTDEDPISFRVGAVENDVCSVDHVSLSLSRDILPLAPHVCKRRPRSLRMGVKMSGPLLSSERMGNHEKSSLQGEL